MLDLLTSVVRPSDTGYVLYAYKLDISVKA